MGTILEHPAYIRLRNVVTERTTPIIAWVGAGLSAAAGLPTWNELRASLQQVLEQKIEGLKPESREFLEGKRRAALQQLDPWVAFEILRDALGETTFRQTVRDCLRPAGTAPIPEAYQRLWAIRVRGILTLNLDRLATRSFNQVHPGTIFDQFSGRDIGAHATVLRGTDRFVAHLHGDETDATGWVLTKPELDALLGQEDYLAFLQACLMTHTVIFVGVSATDRAVRSHLEKLKAAGVDFGGHYWITDTNDEVADRLAESMGVVRVPYETPGGSHDGLLIALRDLASFVPPDDAESPGDPVAAASAPVAVAPLPPPAEIVVRPAEEIRIALNSEARRILQGEGAGSVEEYREFGLKYDEAIARAWYIPRTVVGARLLGYTLEGQLGKGAFGRIFRARAADGSIVAVKLLHDEVRHQEEMLFAFRRGVKAMEILRTRNIQGVVAYRDASEIPAMVVMDLIAGPNLEQSVLERRLGGWHPILKVGCELADIIHAAHQTPERVLHRDLRPANVMLSDQYSDPDEWRTVVLDFDLSWHRGAIGMSLLPADMSSATGYLAPEQLLRDKAVSTRNAAVDAFGLAMTMFFTLAKRHPVQFEHRHRDWRGTLRGLAQENPCREWRSLPGRFARLIEFCTIDRQEARWDLAMARAELHRIQQVLHGAEVGLDSELLAEEIAARSSFGLAHEWDANRAEARRAVPEGAELLLTADPQRSRVRLRVCCAPTGVGDRRRWTASQQQFREGTTSDLRRGGWGDLSYSTDPDVFLVDAAVTVRAVEKGIRIDDLARAADAAARRLRV